MAAVTMKTVTILNQWLLRNHRISSNRQKWVSILQPECRMIFTFPAISSISTVEAYGTHLPTIMDRGQRLTTTTCPMPYAATLAKKYNITGMITQGVTRKMEKGKSISIFGQTGMKCIGVIAVAADPHAIIPPGRIKGTRENL